MIIVFAAKSFSTSGALGYFSTSRLDIAPWLLFLQQKAFFYIWHSMLFLLNICLKLTPFCIVHSHFFVVYLLLTERPPRQRSTCAPISLMALPRAWYLGCETRLAYPNQYSHSRSFTFWLSTVHCGKEPHLRSVSAQMYNVKLKGYWHQISTKF